MALMIPKATSDISRGQPLNAEWWRFFKSVEVSLNAGGLAEQLAAIQKELAELREPGILPVKSVNGKHGAVILDAGDVGADPAGTATAAVAAHVAEPDPHPQYVEEAPEDGTPYARKDGDWSPVQSKQNYQRMTAEGDFRVTADGSLRITD